MKNFLIALLLSVLLALPVPTEAKHKQYDPFNGFDPYEVELAGVGAISIPNPDPSNGDGPYAMICSGALIGYDGDGDGLFLTARHCVFDGDEENGGQNPQFIPNEVVSFAANLSGPYFQTEVESISQKDDLAVLKVINASKVNGHYIIPEVFEDEHNLAPGDPVENVSFPLDMGKLEFHGTFIAPIFPHFSRIFSDYPQWNRTMPVDITIGHGSSGSPLFDSRTHKLIGVMVGTSGEAQLMVAEPFTAVADLLLHPDKNTPVQWAGQNLPKEQFRMPPRDREREKHPYIPGI